MKKCTPHSRYFSDELGVQSGPTSDLAGSDVGINKKIENELREMENE